TCLRGWSAARRWLAATPWAWPPAVSRHGWAGSPACCCYAAALGGGGIRAGQAAPGAARAGAGAIPAGAARARRGGGGGARTAARAAWPGAVPGRVTPASLGNTEARCHYAQWPFPVRKGGRVRYGRTGSITGAVFTFS